MLEKKHTSLEGLKEILEYRASLNWGLSPKETFLYIIPAKKVKMDENILSNLSSEWVAEFSTGEFNFFITLSGTRVWLRFSIAQDLRDLELLKSLVELWLHSSI